jgi:asparagine synthase (glutamine-hydrolysing)
MKLGILFSGGKDSTYAMYKAMKDNEIACLITLKSENPDSYMFHTPNINLTEMQAEALGYPLLTATTKGEKEKELADLKNAIKKAKQLFHIEGIVTGALWSEYQASRIKDICDALNLECVNPLWHMDQEEEMRDILNAGFKFILTRIAAYGLDRSYLGKIITPKDIDKLSILNKKYKTNIAGEGGEFESLVIDGPIFKTALKIEDAETIMENEYTGFYKINKVYLET